jgi:wyosine [tRNA(Phe)-imidazoG37] synthetase (radical SAM superfamily)
LGRSLGVNNIPHKVCTYSCVYCQVGRTPCLQRQRRSYYEPAEILRIVQDKLQTVFSSGDTVDFLTFVPDGEATLDLNLGATIDLLKSCGPRIAVISNGSMNWRQDVRETLQKADWVSLKVDSTTEKTWRRINRPHGTLELNAILEGIAEFRRGYNGILVTETMLVRDLNDDDRNLVSIAEYLGRLKPQKCFLSIPIRPPAERWVLPPTEEILAKAFQILSGCVEHVELLVGYEGNAFAFTGNPELDLLSITAVHPMREEAVAGFLRKAEADWAVVRKLIDQGLLIQAEYGGWKFYLRRFPKTMANR